MKDMMKNHTFALLLVATGIGFSAGTAVAQTLPEDPALQRSQAQTQANQQMLQTQQNNQQIQLQNQQNQMRQQQLFNSLPAPAYQQRLYVPPPPPHR
jgi:hypothetical protein